MDIADRIKVDFVFMQPLLVEEDWMFVRLVDMNLSEKGKGWIRWKTGRGTGDQPVTNH
jgi:hypothetical protein